MTDFITQLLELVFFLFDKVDSILFLTVFGVFLFCFSFKFIHAVMRLGERRRP